MFRIISLSLWLVLVCSVCWAQDVPNSEDHPIVSRFEGARIVGYSQKEFDRYPLLLGPTAKGENGQAVATKMKELEGRVTRLVYLGPRDASPLQVYRSYQDALEAQGFETLFSGYDEELGFGFHSVLYQNKKRVLKNLQLAEYAFYKVQDPYHLAAYRSGSAGEKDLYLSLYVARHTGNVLTALSNNTLTLLEVIEVEPMEAGKVQVNLSAQTMRDSLQGTGKAVIYDIFFDTDKTYPTEKSAPALQEIIKLLKAEPDLRLYVVGHTDDEGDLEYNLELSQKRAETVAKFLEDNGNLAPGRLVPKGVGPLAPVSTHRTAEGRAKNRRVELVKISE